jgi:hypothetical protein
VKDTNGLRAMGDASKTKTAGELSEIIVVRLGRDGVFVSVHPNAGYGWHATVVTAPARTLRSRRRVEEIAAQMRAEGYKLR